MLGRIEARKTKYQRNFNGGRLPPIRFGGGGRLPPTDLLAQDKVFGHATQIEYRYNVLCDIKVMLEELEIDAPKFGGVYFDV